MFVVVVVVVVNISFIPVVVVVNISLLFFVLFLYLSFVNTSFIPCEKLGTVTWARLFSNRHKNGTYVLPVPAVFPCVQ